MTERSRFAEPLHITCLPAHKTSQKMNRSVRIIIACLLCLVPACCLNAQTLEAQLLAQPAKQLAKEATLQGDPSAGAILFHGAAVGCGKCHATGDSLNESLGPNLAKLTDQTTDESLVDSVLRPSKEINKQYATATVLLLSGKTETGILVSQTDKEVTLRLADGNVKRFADDDIDDVLPSKTSIMPKGQVAVLRNRQQFLDIIRYLIELRTGGLERAKQLQPSPAQLALKIPEYEARVDHAGIIGDLDKAAFRRGQQVYDSLCINCHGTLDKAGSLPTALRFGEGKFKNGNDPLSMYRTLTHGLGLMLPQPWMVPTQKHDVIHYIRESFLKRHNESQYFDITDTYLASLPKGDTRGPAPQKFEPWAKMDYGPYLINTYEFGTGMKNIAQKGIAVQLDNSGGGIARGKTWAVFDHDTMRLAGGWTSEGSASSGFIDWRGIHFNGNHGVHPRAVGKTLVSNLDGPGWADPETGSFADKQRVLGRDDRRFGPLPHKWAEYHGLYRNGRRTVISYSVGGTPVLEQLGMIQNPAIDNQQPLIARTLNIGPRTRALSLVVASHAMEGAAISGNGRMVSFGKGKAVENQKPTTAGETEIKWNGQVHGTLHQADAFNMQSKDFTISATINTRKDGTIFSKTTPDSQWTAGGRTLFIRGGRLCLDIGWVGAVQSSKKVANGKDTQVALVWNAEEERATLFINGEPSGSRELSGRDLPRKSAIQIGYTSKNFPTSQNRFQGKLRDVRFFQRALEAEELQNVGRASKKALVAHWPLESTSNNVAKNALADKHHVTFGKGGNGGDDPSSQIIAGMSHAIEGSEWFADGQKLCLRLPAGQRPLKFVLWSGKFDPKEDPPYEIDAIDHSTPREIDLSKDLVGGPALWPQRVQTIAERGDDEGAFAVDRLTRPSGNPWLARTRLTGLDFFDDGDTMAVCSWDGDVWRVTGLSALDTQDQAELSWQRIASGLFQPLGLKIVDGKIFVNCRDQITILNDLNGDGETDFYQCFNDDHQVTEHFHEFAMGLQRDVDGNFYYAKSARHAKTALVPHHGTLLRVTPDGSRTDIIANGFRAANGVCLNPDGSFIVTDQEGHWNPKNRINWVKPGGFYGNIFGYHNVTDESDDAMEQPLCWITNAFDRSPAELLWVDTDKWGPLNNKLLNLSYGYGKVYVVPHQFVGDQVQGGMCQLPLPQFPTGTMRGRFSPHDGQLYLCGMFAWASNQQTQEGGIYRMRYTGKAAQVPVGLTATKNRVSIELSDAVDAEFAADKSHYRVKVWGLKRTASYGSKHYNERSLDIESVNVSDDRRLIDLIIPDLQPTWCMEIVYQAKQDDGRVVERVIHNTIHNVGQ